LNHEFFRTKQLGTGQKTGITETTSDSNKSRVESLVIGANSLHLKTKMLETFHSPSNYSKFDETPQKQQSLNKKAAYRSSIEGAATILEPIMENAHNREDSKVIYKQDIVRQSQLPQKDKKLPQEAIAISAVIN